VNGEEFFPSGTGRTGRRFSSIFANRIDGYQMAKPANFPEDSGGVPGRIVKLDFLDESDCIWKQPRMSGTMCSGDPSPEEGEEISVEANESRRLNDKTELTGGFPESRKESEEESVAVVEGDTFVSAFVDANLEKQNQILGQKSSMNEKLQANNSGQNEQHWE
jgi:hypothetical protein